MTIPQPDPTLAAALAAGKVALDVGDLPTALRHFEDVVASDPANPDGYGHLAAIYAGLGDPDRAEACYGKALEAAPGHTDALYNRGVVRMSVEKFDAAHDDFQAVCLALPADADARNNLAVAAFMRGHLLEARRELQRVLAGAPDHVNALMNLCDVEIAAGDLQAAIRACDAFLDRQPHTEVARQRFDLLVEATRLALAGARGLQAAASAG